MEGSKGKQEGFFGRIEMTMVTTNYKIVSQPAFPPQKNKSIPFYEKELKDNEVFSLLVENAVSAQV